MLKLDIFFSDELTLDISIRDLIESPCCPVLFFLLTKQARGHFPYEYSDTTVQVLLYGYGDMDTPKNC
jgi:hypothetical protein